jgi:hypothetical protein
MLSASHLGMISRSKSQLAKVMVKGLLAGSGDIPRRHI